MSITTYRVARAGRATEVGASEFEHGRVDGLQPGYRKSAEGGATPERHHAASDAGKFTYDQSIRRQH